MFIQRISDISDLNKFTSQFIDCKERVEKHSFTVILPLPGEKSLAFRQAEESRLTWIYSAVKLTVLGATLRGQNFEADASTLSYSESAAQEFLVTDYKNTGDNRFDPETS